MKMFVALTHYSPELQVIWKVRAAARYLHVWEVEILWKSSSGNHLQAFLPYSLQSWKPVNLEAKRERSIEWLLFNNYLCVLIKRPLWKSSASYVIELRLMIIIINLHCKILINNGTNRNPPTRPDQILMKVPHCLHSWLVICSNCSGRATQTYPGLNLFLVSFPRRR